MKLHDQDVPGIISVLDSLAHDNKYEKIVAKIPAKSKAAYEEQGYVQEAVIPEYFKNRDHALFMCKYFSSKREQIADEQQIKDILSLVNQQKQSPETKKNGAPLVNPWSPLHDPPSPKATAWSSAWREGRHQAEADNNNIPPRINTEPSAKADEFSSIAQICRPADADEMSRVFRAVFETYPFPISDATYLFTVMQNKQAQYFCIHEKKRIVAISAAEIDRSNRGVEMTDFVTLPEFRGQGLAGRLLEEMEHSMAEQHMRTAFSIARALSPAMNILFARNGYTFGGTLRNNTNIAGRIESMNVWFKQL